MNITRIICISAAISNIKAMTLIQSNPNNLRRSMGLSALQRSVKAFEISLDSIETWLTIATFFVVVGLLVEYWFPLRQLMEEWVHWRRKKALFPRKLVMEMIGGVLVTLGVAGELYFQFRSSTVEGLIRSDTHQIEALLNKQASDANNRAAKASKDASDASERASKNEREAARLTKDAEDERMARIQLAASISWRTPDRALISQLSQPLRQFAGQRYAFVSDFSDPERTTVLSWLGMLLGRAGWSLEASQASSPSELTLQATNIVLWVSPTAPAKVLEAARNLVQLLETAKLPAVVLQSGWGPKPDAAPPELIRVVIFKKGPRMVVTGNRITFEGSPTQFFFGDGPPH